MAEPFERPPWIDPTAFAIAEIYAGRIFAGDTEALDEAMELVVTARDLRELPEKEQDG